MFVDSLLPDKILTFHLPTIFQNHGGKDKCVHMCVYMCWANANNGILNSQLYSHHK